MHDEFFGPAKKATYLFEPKLDLLRSEIILISRSKNMIFLGKGNLPTLSFCHLVTPKRQHTLPFEPKLYFLHIRNDFDL